MRCAWPRLFFLILFVPREMPRVICLVKKQSPGCWLKFSSLCRSVRFSNDISKSNRVIPMKKQGHPEVQSIVATCSCGNTLDILSTLSEPIHLDVCSSCHPFYTGQQKLMDTGGRIDKYKKRFGALKLGGGK